MQVVWRRVLVEHAAVINLIHAIRSRCLCTSGRSDGRTTGLDISCNFSFAFDGAIHHTLTPLLNGHSVLTVRLISLLESQFGVRLPLAELVNATTIVPFLGEAANPIRNHLERISA